MRASTDIWKSPAAFLQAKQPDQPVVFFSPAALQASAARFVNGFDGLVTYAVKANPGGAVLSNLMAAGIRGFDVASPVEMDLVVEGDGGHVMHYNNPVRSPAEIRHAANLGVMSYSVDCVSELAKLVGNVPDGAEIAVRFRLPIKGAAYDFGAKFGADEGLAAALLRQVVDLGYRPALTFHVGTQCHDPSLWVAYIRAAGRIVEQAKVSIERLNVGGGFPSHRLLGQVPDLEGIFQKIHAEVAQVFGDNQPALICEPGRAMVGDSFVLATRVKAVRGDNVVFLNDGIYGGLAEHLAVGGLDRIQVFATNGAMRRGDGVDYTVFGPTCDSLDKLPQSTVLPSDLSEGDYVLFHGLGAYCQALATRFNGYGDLTVETVAKLNI